MALIVLSMVAACGITHGQNSLLRIPTVAATPIPLTGAALLPTRLALLSASLNMTAPVATDFQPETEIGHAWMDIINSPTYVPDSVLVGWLQKVKAFKAREAAFRAERLR